MEQAFQDPTLCGNGKIKEAIHQFYQMQTDEQYELACFAVRDRMLCEGHLLFPADIIEGEGGATNILFKTMDIENMTFLVAFTDQENLLISAAFTDEQQQIKPNSSTPTRLNLFILFIIV